MGNSKEKEGIEKNIETLKKETIEFENKKRDAEMAWIDIDFKTSLATKKEQKTKEMEAKLRKIVIAIQEKHEDPTLTKFITML